MNYGQLVRDLFLDRLGGQSVDVIEPGIEPFPGTATTGAITTFTVTMSTVSGKPMSARFARVTQLSALDGLSGGQRVRRERLADDVLFPIVTRARN